MIRSEWRVQSSDVQIHAKIKHLFSHFSCDAHVCSAWLAPNLLRLAVLQLHQSLMVNSCLKCLCAASTDIRDVRKWQCRLSIATARDRWGEEETLHMSECQGSFVISTSVTGSAVDGVQLLSQLWNVLETSSKTLVANRIVVPWFL
jgi:hypothetical protein